METSEPRFADFKCLHVLLGSLGAGSFETDQRLYTTRNEEALTLARAPRTATSRAATPRTCPCSSILETAQINRFITDEGIFRFVMESDRRLNDALLTDFRNLRALHDLADKDNNTNEEGPAQPRRGNHVFRHSTSAVGEAPPSSGTMSATRQYLHAAAPHFQRLEAVVNRCEVCPLSTGCGDQALYTVV